MESVVHCIQAGAFDLAREAIRERLMTAAATSVQNERISVASSMLDIDDSEETEE